MTVICTASFPDSGIMFRLICFANKQIVLISNKIMIRLLFYTPYYTPVIRRIRTNTLSSFASEAAFNLGTFVIPEKIMTMHWISL